MEMQPEIEPNKAAVLTSAQPDTPPSAVSSIPTSVFPDVPVHMVKIKKKKKKKKDNVVLAD